MNLQTQRLNLLVRAGTVVDGTGGSRRRADVGVIGDRIVEVGLIDADADRVIDATGMIVSPGFVDPHSHSDMTLHANRDAHSTIRQGVTTEIVGNCGMSNAPVSAISEQIVSKRLQAFGASPEVPWRGFGEYLDDVQTGGIAQNLAFFVGHSTIREAAGVEHKPPTYAQTKVMRDLVREAMGAGALGMSSGLEYKLGRYATTGEVEDLVDVVGDYDGYYASHIRNRDAQILDAVEEFLRIARHGGVAAQISHLNVRHDTNAPERGWERAVEKMTAARAQGIDVQADATPFVQGLGVATGLLPEWLLADGYRKAAEGLRNKETRRRVREDGDRYWRFVYKGQWSRVRLLHSPQYSEWTGRTFEDIADSERRDPWDCYFDVLAAAGEEMGNINLVGHLFTDEHVAQTISHPLFSLGVDTWSSVDHGALSELTPSPLPYAGHIEYLAHHVREKRTLRLEEAIRKMTSMPAERYRLRDRGRLERGYFADIVVFDEDNVASDSTFERPFEYPRGISAVVVNGELAVQDDIRTSARCGRVLRRDS